MSVYDNRVDAAVGSFGRQRRSRRTTRGSVGRHPVLSPPVAGARFRAGLCCCGGLCSMIVGGVVVSAGFG